MVLDKKRAGNGEREEIQHLEALSTKCGTLDNYLIALLHLTLSIVKSLVQRAQRHQGKSCNDRSSSPSGSLVQWPQPLLYLMGRYFSNEALLLASAACHGLTICIPRITTVPEERGSRQSVYGDRTRL